MLAQTNADRVYRVGLISYAPLPAERVAGTKRLFAQMGYREGENIRFEFRSSARDKDATAAHARELVDMDLDLIWGMNTNAVVALRAAIGDRDTPVVFWATDPVEAGIVPDLRERGTFTGFAAPVDLQLLQVRFLRATFPGLKTIPLLYNSGYGPAPSALRQLQVEAGLFGMQVEVCEARSLPEIEPLLESIAHREGKAFLVGPHALFNTNGAHIGQLALRHRLAAVAVQESILRGGGLASFYPSGRHLQEGILAVIDRILKGTPVQEIGIDRKIGFSFGINQNSARELGLQLPGFLLQEADLLL